MRIVMTAGAFRIALGLVLVVTGPALAEDTAATGAAATAKAPLVVALEAQGGSGELGTATLVDTAAGLVVTLHLNEKATGPQPAHIHPGSCADPQPTPAYKLSNVVGGKSVTTIPNETIAKLAGKVSINVHRSMTDFAYVSCGDVVT